MRKSRYFKASAALSARSDSQGVIGVDRRGTSEEQVLEAALEAGAEDVDTEMDDRFRVLTSPNDLHAVQLRPTLDLLPLHLRRDERLTSTTSRP